MIGVGFIFGILYDTPDGLERVLIDQNGESRLENLVFYWIRLLSWITNDYGVAIVGIVLSVLLMSSAFYIIIHYKKKNSIKITE